jgi:hypothetical protein
MRHGGRPKVELVLSTEERLALERLANRRKSAQAMAMRARIVMCCAKDGAMPPVPRVAVPKMSQTRPTCSA